MSSKKKELEIIFNLQWKHGPKVAERSNIVGVYDLPSTTLNWEPFKSYILKNSGTPGDDVKVSYMEEDREFTIESALDFQTALYTFRKKAMNGEIINLRLERLSYASKSVRLTPTCDAQTECSYDDKLEKAPEWFVSYMEQFKKDILEEMVSTMITHTAVLKPKLSHSHYKRKLKPESSKRSKKNHLLDGNEKEVLKTMKLEKKIQSKMEKLVNKSRKLKEKKMSLITVSSDSDGGHSSSNGNFEAISSNDILKMSAAPVRFNETVIPHLMGGEVYRHCWKVINNGLLPWTEETELHFSWGSSLLEPIQRILACPLLNPGEVGTIEALIHVPRICGRYQMYWHFHHRGRKFGHWLGCEIIVDKVNSTEQLSTSFLRSLAIQNDTSAFASKINTPGGSLVDNDSISAQEKKVEKDTNAAITVVEENIKDFHISEIINSSMTAPSRKESNGEIEGIRINKSPSKIQIVEDYYGTTNKNRSEWVPARLINEENDGNINQEEAGDSQSESISKIDEDTISNSSSNDMVMVDFPDDSEPISGYAYINVNGTKTAIPKMYLREDFLETAEDAPDPEEPSGTLAEQIQEILMKDSRKDDFYIPNQENREYDDLPELIASDGNESPFRCPGQISVAKTNPFMFSERFAEYEAIGGTAHGVHEELMMDAKKEKDSRSTVVKDETRQLGNIPFRYLLSGSSLHNEKISMSTSNPSDQSETSQIYPSLDNMKNFMPHVPNYQQTLPELRPKAHPLEQEFPKDAGRTGESTKPESTTGNFTDHAGISKTQDEVLTPNEATSSSSNGESDMRRAVPEASAPIASVVSDAMTIASSAFKNVVNKIIPTRNEEELGVWVNGHWVPTTENSIRMKNLEKLADMGFYNRDRNATLLARYNDDMVRVVAELLQ